MRRVVLLGLIALAALGLWAASHARLRALVASKGSTAPPIEVELLAQDSHAANLKAAHEALQAHRDDVRRCYDEAGAAEPPNDTLLMKLLLDAAGAVVAVDPVFHLGSDAEVFNCVQAAAFSWRFPPPKGEGAWVKVQAEARPGASARVDPASSVLDWPARAGGVFELSRSGFARCEEEARAAGGVTLRSTTVMLTIDVGSDARVRKVVLDQLAGTDLGDCIEMHARALRFPPPERLTQLKFPLELSREFAQPPDAGLAARLAVGPPPGDDIIGGAPIGIDYPSASPVRAEGQFTAQPASVIGPLDVALVRRVLHANRAQVQYCYRLQLERSPKLAGQLTLRFVVTTTGSVSTAMVLKSTFHDAAFEQCVVARVKTWQFPKPAGGGIAFVTYPFDIGSEGK